MVAAVVVFVVVAVDVVSVVAVDVVAVVVVVAVAVAVVAVVAIVAHAVAVGALFVHGSTHRHRGHHVRRLSDVRCRLTSEARFPETHRSVDVVLVDRLLAAPVAPASPIGVRAQRRVDQPPEHPRFVSLDHGG